MIIALDAMGGDRAPSDPVRGAVLANHDLGLQVALVGSPEMVREELSHHGPVPSGIEVVAASEAIAMDEPPALAVRQKKQASINIAMDLVKRGVASSVVSSGNTGATMASALLNLGRIPGIERPAIGAMAPYTSRGTLVLDVGANVDCKPSYLVQFAQMGAIYMERVLGVNRPRVGLFNIGEEAAKGTDLMQEVYAQLQGSDLHFVGNIEPHRLHYGPADVIVTDGFTGNIAVKVTEGVADFIFSELKRAIGANLRYRLAALALRPALLQMRRRLDYGEYGGVPLLGVNGVVIVAHGRADALAMKSALRTAREATTSGMLDALREALGRDTHSPAAASARAGSNSDETTA